MAASAKSPKTLGLLAAITAIALFVLALLGLVAALNLQERAERRSGLLRDVHWVERNLRFSVAKDLDGLGRLGADWDGRERARVEERSAETIQESAGLVGIALLDDAGRARASVPARGPAWPPGASASARERALASGSPAWGETYGAGQDRRVDVFVPWFRDGKQAGTVVGTYGLRVMLAGVVPWWLAEKHRVTLRDGEGKLLAERTELEEGAPELSLDAALELPGSGLVLGLESFGGGTRLLRNVLTGAIVLLTLAVLWNLWALRRHVRIRMAAEDALRAEHAFRKAMEDSLHTGMRAVDLEGRIVYVNAAFCRMVGYSEAELLGSATPQPYWPPEDAERIAAAVKDAREGGMPSTGLEMRLVRRGGERFDALLYEAPLIDAAGRQTGWMGSVLDTTERKRAREELRQREAKLAATARLVTMGEMASTLAHELNQPLAAISGYAAGCVNLLDAEELPRGDLRAALGKVAAQAQRAGRIIRRVHDFVRKREPAWVPVRLDAVIEEAVGFVEAEARKRRVRIATRLGSSGSAIRGDPLLLQQVVLNLLLNAMDAMEGTAPERREIRIEAGATGGQVTVSISDRGCGIPDGDGGRLFEPFYTTKGDGMGMGLNICRTILESHRGRVWAEANPGGGTTFTFSVPVEGA